MEIIWVKKKRHVGSQAVLPQMSSVKGVLIEKYQHETWTTKRSYLASVNIGNYVRSYTLKQFEQKISKLLLYDSGCYGSMMRRKDKLSVLKKFKGANVSSSYKECLILSPKFKFVDEDLVILRAPRKNDVYSLDLKNIIPSGGVTCLVAKAQG
ncbi:hypothetical protein Tco_1165207 [Tanacetum coccineum]